MHADYALILVFLGLVMPMLGRRRVQQLLSRPETTQGDRLRLYASTITMQWLLTALIFWRGEAHGLSPADFGLAIPKPALAFAVALGLGGPILANQLLALRMAGHIPDRAGGVTAKLALRIFPQSAIERLVFFFVVVTVAICEELIYRGFLQHLFSALFSSVVAGLLLSAALFSVAHLYQGPRGITTTGVVGILFGVARAWTGTQLPGMLSHFIADLVAGFLLPQTLRGTSEAGIGSETLK